MSIPYNQLAYSQGQGSSQIPAFIFETRDPTAEDYNINFKLYTGWVNTVTKAIWYLEAIIPVNGFLTSQWRSVGPIVVALVPPTTSDYQFPIGQTWIDTVAMQYWGLVNVTGTVATWENLSSGVAAGILTLTGNTGGSVAGDGARNINIIGSGGVTVTGTPLTNTLTVSLTGGSTAIDSIGVNNSSGTGTNPVLPTAAGLITVTGAQVAPATTSTVIQTSSLAANTYTIEIQRSKTEPASTQASNGVSHFNNADFTVDNNGFVSLTSPGGTAFTAVAVQVFTTSGTYTPTSGMKYCIVEVVAGGAAAGGVTATGGTSISVGSGGGGGEYALGVFSSATIGVSQTVTVGAGGTGVVGATGNPGGNTSVGALISANGGLPGVVDSVTSPALANAVGGLGGTGGAGGSYRSAGQGGFYAWGLAVPSIIVSLGGDGGDSLKGQGGNGGVNNAGTPGSLYGSGGGGHGNIINQPALAGGNGASGIVIVTEYI